MRFIKMHGHNGWRYSCTTGVDSMWGSSGAFHSFHSMCLPLYLHCFSTHINQFLFLLLQHRRTIVMLLCCRTGYLLFSHSEWQWIDVFSFYKKKNGQYMLPSMKPIMWCRNGFCNCGRALNLVVDKRVLMLVFYHPHTRIFSNSTPQ